MRCHFNFLIFAPVLVSFFFLSPYFDTAYGRSDFESKEFVSDSVFIVSNDLFIDICSGNSEFKGDVKFLYGEVIIESDYLKVVSCNDSTIDLFGTDSINELVAEGNVKVSFDDKIAITDHAIYSVVKNELVLAGGNSSVSCLNGTIHGEKFICCINEKKIFIESATDRKVTANILP